MDNLKKPDVSVIVAAYNVENYIERALRSALEQTGVTLEVIVIDDCSTDETLRIASNIGDARLRCLRLPENAGPGAARNAGLAEARGRWIAILDGDDAFAPGRLARCVSRAENAKADVAVDNLMICPEDGSAQALMFRQAPFSSSVSLSLADFIEGNSAFLGGWTLGYLKPVFSAAFLREKRLAYMPEIRIGEDYLLMAECLASGAICITDPAAGYLYTIRPGSISHRLSAEDVSRISAGDARFLRRHQLEGRPCQAQKRRARKLKEAYAFTRLVDGIKRKKIFAVASILVSYPVSGWYLWRPIWARLRIIRNARRSKA